MNKPARINEVFLQPGGFHFDHHNTRIRTTLGSCVSIVMWHNKEMLGGMSHYVLPGRSKSHRTALDGRYAEDVMELFMRKIRSSGTRPQDYQVKIFGGGSMFKNYPQRGSCKDVPCQNVLAARALLKRYRLKLVGEDLGGAGHRQVVFDIWNGNVWVRRVEIDGMSASMHP